MNNQVENKTDCERNSQSVFWVFTKQILDDNILKGIKETNIEHIIVDYLDLVRDKNAVLRKYLYTDKCYVVKCDLGSQAYLDTGLYPGVYCDFEKFQCISYYPHLKDLLLNYDYILLPWLEVKNKFNQYAGKFIRPNSGFKSFVGGILDKSLLNERIQDTELCLLAPFQEIDEEYRFTVANSTIIGASGYMKQGEIDYTIEIPSKAYDITNEAIKLYRPEKIFCMDVCKLQNGEYKVLELNSFSCSGMYNTDFGNVIREVNKAALEEYNEYNTI